jgi:thioredoxin-related protein
MENHVAQVQTGKKPARMLWIIILVFIIFFITVLLTENKEDPTTWWNKDYNAGIELAKQQHKPALLCFFKQGTRFSSDMWEYVYSKPHIRKYVKANFIPILIDVDKQPELAERYNVTYYPTHYVEFPDANEIDGPFLGAHRLFEFIQKPRSFTKPL